MSFRFRLVSHSMETSSLIDVKRRWYDLFYVSSSHSVGTFNHLRMHSHQTLRETKIEQIIKSVLLLNLPFSPHLKVLDRFDAQLLRRVFIADDDCVGMLLECAYRPHMIHALFNCFMQSERFTCSRYQNHHLLFGNEICLRS